MKSGDINQHFHIRSAKPSESRTLTILAKLSKAYWKYSTELLAKWETELTITPEIIEANITLVIEIDEEIVGFCSQPTAGTQPFDSYFFIHPNCIGKGYGRQLWKAMVTQLKQLELDSFSIIVEPNALDFYLKMGCHKIGEQVSDIIPGRMLPIVQCNFNKLG